jgi:uncharacterized protein
MIQQLTQAEPATVPSAVDERLPALDLLRGIAILAILLANIPYFSGPADWFYSRGSDDTLADRVVVTQTLFWIDGKFITLFSILFGAGMALQVDRARASGQPFMAYYLRRLAILLLIGLIHALFIWFGDILTAYALVGLVAFALSRMRQEVILACMTAAWVWAYGCLVLFTLVVAIEGESFWAMAAPATAPIPPASRKEGDQGPMEEMYSRLREIDWEGYVSKENQIRIYRDGTWRQMFDNRAIYLLTSAVPLVLVMGWYLLGCFLLGMYLMRRGIFHDVDAHRPFLCRLIGFGLLVGVPFHMAGVAVAWLDPNSSFSWLLNGFGALPMALAYLGLILFWSRSTHGLWLQRRLRAVGRMALTNYLMQSVLCTFLFYSYGFRLYGELSRTTALSVVVSIWVLQLALSPLWLRHFQMGPVEWVWRSFAQGHPRPFLRQS